MATTPDLASLLLWVILALSALSASSDVNIDCGTSDIYNSDSLLTWTGDESFMQNGVSQIVQSSKSVSREMSTLRVFTTRNKNCYAIKVDKGQKILLRASFYYGNYDKKSSPPTFDLHFDGNFWATVVTSIDEVVTYEVIYVVKSDAASLCVAQTKANQLPFVSAIQVVGLESNMYQHVDSSHAMFLTKRVAFGSTETIRYSDDAYDRIWLPSVTSNGLTAVTNDAIFIDVTKVPDNPPTAVLDNAVTASTVSTGITLGTGLPSTPVPIYINMYFSEVTQLDSTQKRSFQIYENSDAILDPILPPYQDVTEMYVTNMTASSNTSLSLVASTGSTLPPLINAMEVFIVSDELTDGTSSSDVEGLVVLQTEFEILQDWVSDPCLPATYTWDWVQCSSAATPRVTAMDLSSFGLVGPVPDFSSMDGLVTIDLHNNSFNGAIPAFLGTLPNLRQLNLADNDFSGPIPSSISSNSKIKLVVTGNPNVCATGKSCAVQAPVYGSGTTTTTDVPTTSSSSPSSGKKKKKNKQGAILGSTIPTSIVLSLVAIWGFIRHKRKRQSTIAASSGGSKPNGPGGRPQPNPQGAVLANTGKIEAMLNRCFKSHIEEEVLKDDIEDQVTQEVVNEVQDHVNGDQQQQQQDGRTT